MPAVLNRLLNKETKCPKTWKIKSEIEINICQEGKQSKDTKGVKDRQKVPSPLMEDSKDDTTAAPKSKSNTKAITTVNLMENSQNHPSERLLVVHMPMKQNPKTKAALKYDGKLMDVNEDDDLNGKDTASLQEILKSEKPDWWETAGKSLKDLKKLLIKSEPAHGKTNPNISNTWPEPEANIIYPVAGEIKLKDQHPKLQSALWGGMQEMVKYLLFTNTYPPVESRTLLVQQWFYTAAKLEKADMIRRQILACSTTFRSDIKDASSKGATACYNLTSDKTEKFVNFVNYTYANWMLMVPCTNSAMVGASRYYSHRLPTHPFRQGEPGQLAKQRKETWHAKGKTILDRSQFSIKDGQAKCLICPTPPTKSSYFNISNLGQHAKGARHLSSVSAWKLQQRKEVPVSSDTNNDSNFRMEEYEAFSGEPSNDFGDATADLGTPEPLYEAVAGPPLPDDNIMYSTGEEPISFMAESLAQALRNSGLVGEAQLPDEGFDFDENDPFYCDGPEESSEALLEHWFGSDAKSKWFLYPDKALFLTDLLFSSPRLKFSRAQQKAILSWANELGATVPSYKKFRTTQTGLPNELGNPMSHVESGWGNVYYLNEIGDSIAKDGLNVQTDHLETVEVSTFSANIEMILSSNTGIYPFSDLEESRSYCDKMPHPLRKVAGSRMVYSVPLVIFQDDVSGNRSKQWNKHYLCYLSNGTIPCQKLESEFHSSGNYARHTTFDRIKQKFYFDHMPCCFLVIIQCRQSFAALPAYAVTISAEHKHKQSDEGFSELFKEGIYRTSEEMKQDTLRQLFTALQPAVSTTLVEAVRSSGTKDTLAQPVIDNLVKLGQQLQKNNPERAAYTLDEVQSILMTS
ncbi:hypothetical protein BJV74DRAFT_799986 [Russula compacta]|nr:hypothetical protein BJV74DRAFT_799986 [Russula compacta]